MKDVSMLKKQIILGACVLGLASSSYAITPFNIIRPFDPNFFPTYWKNQTRQFTPLLSFGASNPHGRTVEGETVNVLQFLFPTQDALAMLKGFAPTSQQAQLGQLINIDGDDGVRGHFQVTGNLRVVFSGDLIGRWNWENGVWLGMALPLASLKVKNVTWVDQTKNATLDDALTHQYLTDNFAANVEQLGNGLSIGDWEKAGVGDFTTYVGWRKSFLQEKKWLKEAIVNVRLGVQFPTGVRKDEDVAVSLAFGNDGAYTIPFAAGLDLRFKKIFWAGIDLTFMKMFSHIRDRRIQTNATQTDLLALEKTRARKEYGLTQMFNLYAEPIIGKGLSVRFAYEHFKHGDDKIFVMSNDYSTLAANTAAILNEWTTHDLLIQLKYDSAHQKGENNRFRPQFSIFGKMPFNGKCSYQVSLIGASATFSF